MKNGIDVSEHQAIIDWDNVKNQIDFVILRIGWIGNKNNHTLDKYFERNYNECKRLGIPIGIYVYNYCKSLEAVESGVNWIKEHLKNKSIEYPIFIDQEDSTITGCGKEMLTEMTIKFCENLKIEGYQVGVYANLNWFNNHLNINKLLNYKIWLAEWTNKESHSANFKVDLWQYASNGIINGISDFVDMNKCLNCEEKEQEITGKKTNEEIANEVIKGDWRKWTR